MNIWTKKSIELANQKDYLDQLFKVYPIADNLKREVNNNLKTKIKDLYDHQDKFNLLNILLNQKKFPVKDSYVPYLKKDREALKRNPNTVDRLCGKLFEMGFDSLIDGMTVPKEANRQMGPLFNNWLLSGSIGAHITDNEMKFLNSSQNMIFSGKDAKMKEIAIKHLGYTRKNKGLDLLAKFNNNYVIGEAKFLTDFGGHQNDQIEDAFATLRSKLNPTGKKVHIIAILDGVLYIPSKNKMHRYLENAENNEIILSSLFLRDYLY